jgi:thiol-disulfide isomerase/thioredoxin
MNARMVLSTIFLSLALAGANAQTAATPKTTPPAAQPKAAAPEQAAKPAVPETPPDRKAFQDATKITDPAEKIAALEKFKKDFPESSMVGSATMNIFTTMASKMKDKPAAIQEFAATMYQGESDQKKKVAMAGQLADSLLSNDVLLKEAEKYATISLNAMNQADYLKEQKESLEKRKVANPDFKGSTDEELIKRFQQSRATRVAVLGRIEFKLGKTKEAKKLLDESYGVNPDQPLVTAALGELNAKHGDKRKAMDYLVTAKLTGRAPASANEALDQLYRKSHKGTLNGFDAMLDSEYNKKFPNPLHLDAYKPTEKRSDRMVLAEVFTGSGCPPCVGADLAFEAVSERYARKDFVAVMYHEHIPQPDPMTNPDTQARLKYYAVGGVPTYFIDGETVKFNGANREGTKGVWEHIQKPIETDLEKPAEARLNVHAGITGKAVSVRATVDGVKSESKDLKLHVLLLEKELKYSGENGIRFHPMVVRAMGGKDDDGFALTAGGAASFDQAWDLDKVSAGLKAHLDDYEAKGHRGNPFKFSEKKYQIDSADLAVVVFVQDAKTKHILQSTLVDLNQQAPPVTTTEATGSR